MRAAKFLLLYLGIPALIGLLGATYLLGAHWLMGRLGVDRERPWYAVALVGSLLLILYVIAELSP